MEQFTPNFRGEPWSEDRDGPGAGARALHIYAVPDLTVDKDLAALVEQCRTAMRGHPILPAVDRYLHLTLDVVAARYSDTVSAAERAVLVETLEAALADVGAFTLQLGSPLAGRAGGLLDVSPDCEVDALHRAIRAAVQQAVPSDYVYPVPPVHCSLGYSYAVGSSDQLQSAFRRIRPSHAPMTVDSVQLVDVRFRQVPVDEHLAWDLSWDHVATIALKRKPPC